MATQVTAPTAISILTPSGGEESSGELPPNISMTGALQMASHSIVAGETYTNLQGIVPDINFNINEEDFDDDDFDEEFSDEFYEDEDEMTDVQKETPEADDMTKQLLDFTKQVNSDIQKYFGRKKEEDSCDIYEDKWTTKKSGRELYLADILRIANGGETAEDTRKGKKAISQSKKNEQSGSLGKVNKKAGLGPLDELFKDVHKDSKETMNKYKKPKRLQNNNGKGISLQERKLPSSFWIEPSLTQCSESRNKNSGSIPPKNQSESGSHGKPATHAPSTPDFSDLLESWTREESSSGGTATQTTITTAFSGQTSAMAIGR